MAAVLAPSILSADFTRLGEEVRAVEAGGAAMIHVDVMDGHFVPQISMGPAIASAVRRVTDLPIDCHLMVENPERAIPDFIAAGADMISIHVEVTRHLHRAVQSIKNAGLSAGVVLNPATPIASLSDILPLADFVLLMSVNPGFGGQVLIPEVLGKARTLREWIDRERFETRIEIDGGVKFEHLDEVARSGIDMVVAGSAVFGTEDVQATTERYVRRLAALAEVG